MVESKHVECGKISVKALAISLGVFWGVYVFLLGLLSMANIRIFWFSPEFLNILSTLYPGYAATLTGSLIGLLWGTICGAVGGAIIAWLHNFALIKYCK